MNNELKVQELELSKERFLWDKENYAGEYRLKEQALQHQNIQKDAELKEGTKRAVMLNLMGQGKSAVEIKEMLASTQLERSITVKKFCQFGLKTTAVLRLL